MFYTVFITVVSTLISMGISLGVGKLLKVMNSKKLIDLAKLTKGTTTKVTTKVGDKLVDKLVTKISPAGRLAKMFTTQLKDAKILGVLFSPIKESLQEIFVDPYLETIVTDMVVRAGGNIFWQVLISSIAESGRESISGVFSSTMKGSKDIQASVNDKQISEQTDSTGKEAVEGVLSEKDSQTAQPTRWSSILKSGASLILGTALLGIGGPMFFGASLAGGFSALQSISKAFKRQKGFIRQVVDSESAEIISDLISDLDMVGVSDVMQDAVEGEGISSFEEDSIKFTPEMLEDTQAMRHYNREVESVLRLLAASARGGTWLQEINPNFERAQEKAREEIKLRRITDGLIGYYKFIDKLLMDPIEREALKREYLKGATEAAVEKIGTSINEQTLRDEVTKRFAEVDIVNEMDYFEFWDFYTKNYGNEYSKRMMGLDRSNIDLRTLAMVRIADPNNVPGHQIRLLEEFMRASQRSRNLNDKPYLVYALVNKEKLRQDGEGFLVRVGYTQDNIKREKGYFHDAKAGKWGPVYRDIAAQGKDDFVFVYLDLQYGREAARISEEFFTIYFNRDPLASKTSWSPKGSDLYKNNRYNPIIGDVVGKIGDAHPNYKEIYYYKVKDLIEKGYEMADIAIIHGVSAKTLSNRIKSWGEPGSNFNYDIWARQLRAKKLIDYYARGLHVDEITKQFEKFDLPNKGEIAGHVKEQMRKLDVGSIPIISYSKKAIYSWTEEYLGVSPGTAYEIYYVKPILLTLAKLGFTHARTLKILELMGVTSREGTPYNKDSLSRMLKDRLWGPGQGLTWGGKGFAGESFRDVMMEPMIESLIRYKNSAGKYLSVETIGGVFGLSGGFIKAYMKRRWGISQITQARIFFDTHFLGYHKYDFFMFN